MHISLLVIIIIVTWLRADWRSWKKYHPTLLYVAVCNLLYNCLCANYLLWEYKPGMLLNHATVDLVYTFMVLPAITLLFLSHYPNESPIKRQIRYITMWVLASLIVETIVIWSGYLEFHNGWKFWMEIPFYFTMYSMIRLHQTRPLLTYTFSVIIIVFLINAFDVPFSVPIKER